MKFFLEYSFDFYLKMCLKILFYVYLLIWFFLINQIFLCVVTCDLPRSGGEVSGDRNDSALVSSIVGTYF